MATDATIIQLVATPGIGANTVSVLASAPLGMTCLVYVQPVTVEIWASRSNNRGTATKVGQTAATSGIYLHKDLGTGETWYYWARAVDAEGNVGAFYPVSTTAGVSATTKTTAPGPNSVGTPELQDGAVTDAKIQNLLADKIIGGTISATISINGPTITGGTFRTSATGARIEITGASRSIVMYDSSERRTFEAGQLTSTSSLLTSCYVDAPSIVAGANVDSANAHGLRGRNFALNGGHGIVGVSRVGGGWAFYAQQGNYGPFTGAHDALIRRDDASGIGDIVVDLRVVARDGVDNTLTEVAISSIIGQRGVVGVLSARVAFHPEAHLSGLPYDEHRTGPTFIKKHFATKYDRCTINGVGEGQVNVCGRGGDFDLGDLIIASDLPGKGQRQPDDIVRSYTVARIRESVTFDHTDQVKRVACIYLCG